MTASASGERRPRPIATTAIARMTPGTAMMSRLARPLGGGGQGSAPTEAALAPPVLRERASRSSRPKSGQSSSEKTSSE